MYALMGLSKLKIDKNWLIDSIIIEKYFVSSHQLDVEVSELI